jgi:hypothetical protein
LYLKEKKHSKRRLTMQNEPQLSAEMEKLKSEVRSICKGAYWYGEDSGDYDCTDYDGVDEIMTLLATALNEQRKIDAKIVESMMEDEEHWQPIADAILKGSE